MIDIAIEKASRTPDAPKFIVLDVGRENLPCGPFDAITCTRDSINYLSPEELENFFLQAYKVLGPRGWLIFDLNTERFYDAIVASASWFECSDMYLMRWCASTRGDEKRVDLALTLLMRRQMDSMLFERVDELHEHYVHDTEEIKSSLRTHGFEQFDVSLGRNFRAAAGDQRLLICARRNN